MNDTTPSAIEQMEEEEASMVKIAANADVAVAVAVYVEPATLALVGAVDVNEMVCV